MYKIRIPTTGQIYSIDTAEQLLPGQEILVEAEQIVEPATVLCDKIKKLPATGEPESLGQANFQRVLNDTDQTTKTELKEKALAFLEEAAGKAVRHNLDMKILDADLSFDEKKLTFYFSAENRIDFRSLVADMVGSYRKIIRLQQIGPRDETRLFGGYGRCGQELCCHRFQKNTDKISADLAALQEISGSKLSKMTGCCGRLMCCLSYEMESAKDIKKEVEKK